jgi:hypothetical protein
VPPSRMSGWLRKASSIAPSGAEAPVEDHPDDVRFKTDIPLLDPKIGRGLFASIALNLVLDGLSLVE